MAHGEDAGLGTWMSGHAGAVTGAEHERITAGGKRRLDREEAALVERQAGLGEPGRGTGLRHHEHVVDWQALGTVTVQRASSADHSADSTWWWKRILLSTPYSRAVSWR